LRIDNISILAKVIGFSSRKSIYFEHIFHPEILHALLDKIDDFLNQFWGQIRQIKVEYSTLMKRV